MMYILYMNYLLYMNYVLYMYYVAFYMHRTYLYIIYNNIYEGNTSNII